MKKTMLVFGMFLLSIFLVACDYPEKSLKAINDNDIPNKVTKDFNLPKGIYAAIQWSSSNLDVLKIEDNIAVVMQSEEDVEVILKATVNKEVRNYKVIVLKAGSELSKYEKSLLLKDTLTKTLIINSEGTFLHYEVDGVYINYGLSNNASMSKYYVEEQEDGIFVKSLSNYSMTTNIFFYEDYEKTEVIYVHSRTYKFIL